MLSRGFPSTAGKFFLRLRVSDIPTSDPFNADFDGDKVSNYDELHNGTDPLYSTDTDGDGIPDDWETAYGLNRNDPADATQTAVGGGMTNLQHYQLGSNPNNPPPPPTITAGTAIFDLNADTLLYPADDSQLLLQNGNFSLGDSSLPSLGSNSWWPYPSGIPGWTAISGHIVELQQIWVNATAGAGQYCELDSHWPPGSDQNLPSDHGIQHPVNLARGHYLLIFDYRGRFTGADSFTVKLRAGSAAPVPLAAMNGAATTWKRASVSFEVTGGDPNLTQLPVTLLFDIPDSEARDSYGAFIDNVMLHHVEIAGDNDDDGDIDQADRQARDKHPIVLQRKLNKTNTARTLIVRKIALSGVPVKLVKTGDEKIIIKSKQTGAVLMSEAQSESSDIGPFVSQADYEITVEGVDNGKGTLALKVGDSGTPADPMPIRVLNPDVIFRNGNQTLADLIGNNITHGGFNSGDGNVHDLGGRGPETITVGQFYARSVTGTKRRVSFKQTNYMAGRIWEKIFDNLIDGKYDNPTGAKPWNIFTTSDHYTTTNCLEWLHKQWQRAVKEVHGELQDSQQKAAFEAAYYNGANVNDLVPPDLIKTIQGKVGTAEAYVLALVVLADGAEFLDKGEVDKAKWNNQYEGTYVYFYPGYYGVPLNQVPWWVPGFFDLWSEGQLRTCTPNSYLNSGYFQEVLY